MGNGKIERNIGLIGLGQIGNIFGAQLLEHGLGGNRKSYLNRLILYGPNGRKAKVDASASDLRTIGSKTNVEVETSLSNLGKESDVIIISIGNSDLERSVNRREELTGEYFPEIKEIMRGLGNTNATIVMVTNPISENCFYASQESLNPEMNIEGFTFLDFMRGITVISDYLGKKGFKKIQPQDIKFGLYGPHGEGLQITDIIIRKGGGNKTLEGLLKNKISDFPRLLQRLQRDIVEYGNKNRLHNESKTLYGSTIPALRRHVRSIIFGLNSAAAIKLPMSYFELSGAITPQDIFYSTCPLTRKSGRAEPTTKGLPESLYPWQKTNLKEAILDSISETTDKLETMVS
ncbi:hypothetical protein K8R47_02180 [archaeon]|nr:hypothetical protein [archaeon]